MIDQNQLMFSSNVIKKYTEVSTKPSYQTLTSIRPMGEEVLPEALLEQFRASQDRQSRAMVLYRPPTNLVDEGRNSVDIFFYFGLKTGRKTRPRSGTTSVQGLYSGFE